MNHNLPPHVTRPTVAAAQNDPTSLDIPFSFICNSCQHIYHGPVTVPLSDTEFIGMHQQLDKSLHLYTISCENCASNIKIQETEDGTLAFQNFTARKITADEDSDSSNEEDSSDHVGKRLMTQSGEIFIQLNKDRNEEDFAKLDAKNKACMEKHAEKIEYLQKRQDSRWKDNSKVHDQMIADFDARKKRSEARMRAPTAGRTVSQSVRQKIKQASIFSSPSTPSSRSLVSSLKLSKQPVQIHTLKALSRSQKEKEKKRKRQMEVFQQQQRKYSHKRRKLKEQSGSRNDDGIHSEADTSKTASAGEQSLDESLSSLLKYS